MACHSQFTALCQVPREVQRGFTVIDPVLELPWYLAGHMRCGGCNMCSCEDQLLGFIALKHE